MLNSRRIANDALWEHNETNEADIVTGGRTRSRFARVMATNIRAISSTSTNT